MRQSRRKWGLSHDMGTECQARSGTRFCRQREEELEQATLQSSQMEEALRVPEKGGSFMRFHVSSSGSELPAVR